MVGTTLHRYSECALLRAAGRVGAGELNYSPAWPCCVFCPETSPAQRKCLCLTHAEASYEPGWPWHRQWLAIGWQQTQFIPFPFVII